jgi:hypothetical protein
MSGSNGRWDLAASREAIVQWARTAIPVARLPDKDEKLEPRRGFRFFYTLIMGTF